MNKEIYIGPWIGEFGHYHLHFVPFINAIRKLYDVKIIVGGFEGDDVYLRDNNGNPTCNEYISFPWWPDVRANTESKGKIPKSVSKIIKSFKSQPNHINLTNIPLKDYTRFCKIGPRQYYRYNWYEDNEKPQGIVVMPRVKTGCNVRSWHSKKWRQLINLLTQIDHVFICGTPILGLDSIQGKGITNLTTINDKNKILWRISNARCCVGDVSGGTRLAMMTGCPTIVHGHKQFEPFYTKLPEDGGKNFFGTRCSYIKEWDITPERRMDDVAKFLSRSSFYDRYKRDKLFIEETDKWIKPKCL